MEQQMRFFKRWQATVRWLWECEPAVLVSVLFVVSAGWLFISVASEVVEGDTLAFDRKVVRTMRRVDDARVPIGPAWVKEAGRDVTALGSHSAVVLITAVVAGFLLLDRRYPMTLFLVVASAGGIFAGQGLKQIISRTRPAIVPHLADVSTSSFPSGHAMLSAAVYLTLGTLLAAMTPRRRLKIYVLCVAILLSVLVGVSRVYLGVHYPTDVLAGWSVGATWALLCWLVYRWLHDGGGKQRTGKTV